MRGNPYQGSCTRQRGYIQTRLCHYTCDLNPPASTKSPVVGKCCFLDESDGFRSRGPASRAPHSYWSLVTRNCARAGTTPPAGTTPLWLLTENHAPAESRAYF